MKMEACGAKHPCCLAFRHALTLLVIVACCLKCHGQNKFATTEIRLNGTASSGVLALAELSSIYGGFAAVVTTQGESSESVLQRLADEIASSDSFYWLATPENRRQLVKVAGNTLKLPYAGSGYYFSGTDKGFDVPSPVFGVSGSYNSLSNQVTLTWVNPPEQQDEIRVGPLRLPPYATSCVYSWTPSETRRKTWGVVVIERGGCCHRLPAYILPQTRRRNSIRYRFTWELHPTGDVGGTAPIPLG